MPFFDPTLVLQHLGEVFRKLALQNESRIEEGHRGSNVAIRALRRSPNLAVKLEIRLGDGRNTIGLYTDFSTSRPHGRNVCRKAIGKPSMRTPPITETLYGRMSN